MKIVGISGLTVEDPGEAPGGPGPHLFLDRTDARRAENKILLDRAPSYFRVWMTATPPPVTGSNPFSCLIIFIAVIASSQQTHFPSNF